MNYLKKNSSLLISIFLLISPVIDLVTQSNIIKTNYYSIGLILRGLFLIGIIFLTISTYKKKKLLIPYSILLSYFMIYISGSFLYKDTFCLIKDVQGLIRVFYFPIIFLSLYSLREEIRISKYTLWTTLCIYTLFLYFLFITNNQSLLKNYFELKGIISILVPFIFIMISNTKNILKKIIILFVFIGTSFILKSKTILLSFYITIFLSIIYYIKKQIQERNIKQLILLIFISIITLSSMTITIPKIILNNHKNLTISKVIKDEELVNKYMMNQRLTRLKKKALVYKESNIYQKLFGIGYYKDKEEINIIKMDYFDIYYSHGLIGFLLFFIIILIILYKVLDKTKYEDYENYMYHISLLLVIVLSLLSGSIITSPSSSLICIILILFLTKHKKKNLLFSSKDLRIGGIESSLVNLVNRIDLSKYNVTIILEEKKGDYLSKINKNITIKECKVSDYKIVVIRKMINFIRKLFFKIINYQNYDFSCCYATYSYSANLLARVSSSNNSIYVHSDYSNLYSDEEYINFFKTRHIDEFKRIIFVSNEAKEHFINKFSYLKDKTMVINNFINIVEIERKSKEQIKEKKKKNETLFVFVGRLDDSSKKVTRAINLIKEIENTSLWIIGDGPDKKMYEKLTENLNLKDRVFFFGKKDNPYPYMIQADYVILTSDYEGFPVVYLESILLDKNIITTIPTSDDKIEIRDYAYIVPKDEKEMVKEVKKIIKKPSSKKSINLNELFDERMIRLERIFNDN